MNDYLVKILATYEMEVQVVDVESEAEANARALEIAKDLEQYSVGVADLPEPFAFDNYEVLATDNLDLVEEE